MGGGFYFSSGDPCDPIKMAPQNFDPTRFRDIPINWIRKD